MPEKRVSVLGVWGARMVLIVVALCALLSVLFILFGIGGEVLARVVFTDIALVVFALLVWLDTTIGTRRPEWFEFASLTTDAYLLLLWVAVFWTGAFGAEQAAFDILLALLCLGFVRAMLGVTDLIRLLQAQWSDNITRILSMVSVGALGVLTVLVTIPAIDPLRDAWDHELYGRIVAALAVVGGVGFVLIPLWGLLINRSRGDRGGFIPSTEPGHLQAGGHTPAPAAGQAPPRAPSYQAAPPQALAWPAFLDGSPVPAAADGRPNFAAVAPERGLAWPTFVDGSPVPPAADGSPLYR